MHGAGPRRSPPAARPCVASPPWPGLRAEGHDIKDEDVARPTHSRDRHTNFLSRYLFDIKASGPGQGPRPFRDPDAAEADEEEP
ncbi:MULTISPECIES: hypothetical protein [unclassified Streptomyces]|uniref:hypothetical protein n=1 Tax=unclassified Streptomyces TaxID=2593676 RepID=UPI0003655CED|nr:MULTISPECIES: hypothetical protein [unclassified Streptomyces]MYX34512.1 hypothetical protein [Streptomyces sp. SID8377]